MTAYMISGYNDDTLTSSTFNSPWGLTIDSSDFLYVTDKSNCVVRQITSTRVYTLAGNSASGHVDGSNSETKFANHMGIALVSSGIWVVADNTYVRKIYKPSSKL